MEQIKIGTCIDGNKFDAMLSGLSQYGFETFSINYHMELNGADLKKVAARTNEILDGTGKTVSTVGYYCNPIQNSEHKKTLEYVIDNAHLFGAKFVATFAGAYEGQPVTDALPKFKEVFSDLAKRAADKGLKLVIENCPMGGSFKKATCNIGFNPEIWDLMFDAVPDKNFGLQWEPTHQMCQLIDPMPQLKEYKDRILHIHGKDATVEQDIIKRYGIKGSHPFVHHRFPGFGDCNWRDIIFQLHRNGYADDICIEGYHDAVYIGDWELTGQLHALNYLKWCRGGKFVPNNF